MIYSETSQIKISEPNEVVSFKIYSDNFPVSVVSAPSWLVIPATITSDTNEATIEVYARLMDGTTGIKSIGSALILNSFVDEELAIPCVYDFDATYTTLKEIIDGILIMSSEGTYWEGIGRTQATLLVKKGYQNLSIMRESELLKAELELDDISTLYMPIDAVSPASVKGIGSDGTLYPLYEVKDLNKGVYTHVSDSTGEILSDEIDNPIIAESSIPTAPVVPSPEYDDNGNVYKAQFGYSGGRFSSNGGYTYDHANRSIFISNSPFTKFVLEYNGDPTVRAQLSENSGSLKIHKYWAQAIENWVYWKWVERIKVVPRTEVFRAKTEFVQSEKLAKRASLNYQAIIQSLNTKFNYTR